MTTGSDTIAALATPAGRGGIGIIKISGKEAFGLARAIFRPANSHRDTTADMDLDDSLARPFEFQSHRL